MQETNLILKVIEKYRYHLTLLDIFLVRILLKYIYIFMLTFHPSQKHIKYTRILNFHSPFP